MKQKVRRSRSMHPLLIVGLVSMFVNCSTSKTEEEKPEPTVVRTAISSEGSVTEWLDLQGRVTPPSDRDATIAPLVPGRILLLSVRVGDVVQAGQVVAKIEVASLDDELKAAEAALRRSEADLIFKRGVAKRTDDLVSKGVAAREEAESAGAAAVAAESTVAQDQSRDRSSAPGLV